MYVRVVKQDTKMFDLDVSLKADDESWITRNTSRFGAPPLMRLLSRSRRRPDPERCSHSPPLEVLCASLLD